MLKKLSSGIEKTRHQYHFLKNYPVTNLMLFLHTMMYDVKTTETAGRQKLPIETLMRIMKPVVLDTNVFENRVILILRAVAGIRE